MSTGAPAGDTSCWMEVGQVGWEALGPRVRSPPTSLGPCCHLPSCFLGGQGRHVHELQWPAVKQSVVQGLNDTKYRKHTLPGTVLLNNDRASPKSLTGTTPANLPVVTSNKVGVYREPPGGGHHGAGRKESEALETPCPMLGGGGCPRIPCPVWEVPLLPLAPIHPLSLLTQLSPVQPPDSGHSCMVLPSHGHHQPASVPRMQPLELTAFHPEFPSGVTLHKFLNLFVPLLPHLLLPTFPALWRSRWESFVSSNGQQVLEGYRKLIY